LKANGAQIDAKGYSADASPDNYIVAPDGQPLGIVRNTELLDVFYMVDSKNNLKFITSRNKAPFTTHDGKQHLPLWNRLNDNDKIQTILSAKRIGYYRIKHSSNPKVNANGIAYKVNNGNFRNDKLKTPRIIGIRKSTFGRGMKGIDFFVGTNKKIKIITNAMPLNPGREINPYPVNIINGQTFPSSEGISIPLKHGVLRSNLIFNGIQYTNENGMLKYFRDF